MKRMKFLPIVLLLVLGSTQVLMALNPSRTYKQRPEKYNMKYEEHKVKTADGATLNVWDFPANVKTTKLILMCHNGEGNMGDYLRRVDQFTSIGYNVVFFDYRGFGESSEFEIDNNMYVYPHFQDDVKAMIDWTRMNHVNTFNIYGWGIGAGLGMGIGYNRKEIVKIIADTPFLSMEDLENKFSDWDEPMEVPFAGYDKKHEPVYSLDNPPSISKGQGKGAMLIVGSADNLFKVSEYEGLVKKQKKLFPKSAIYVVENPDKKDNFRVNKSAYFKEIRAFLEDWSTVIK